MKLIVQNPEKLIKFLIHNIQGLSFGNAQKILRQGDVKINGKRTKENTNLSIGDEIDIYIKEKKMPNVEIIYEDDNILIVNKPAGIECATRDKSSENTYSLEEIFAEKNATAIHRLDRLTEGLVILAKNKDIAKEFEIIFRTRQIIKKYIAGVTNSFNQDGVHKAYLRKDNKKAIVHISNEQTKDSKEIISEFKTLEKSQEKSLVEITLHTGRTHQIRAHLNFLNHPIINDNKYGKEKVLSNKDYNGYFLTAYKLDFKIEGKLSYLNNLHFEISPSWRNLY